LASDAHCHPYYLHQKDSGGEEERIRLNIKCAASAFNKTDFLFNEELSKKSGLSTQTPYMALCYAVHPQLPLQLKRGSSNYSIAELKLFLENLASEKRISAVGETGFDLYGNDYKATEEEQQNIFEHHLQLALEYKLPIVLHVRRAMHKIFNYCAILKELPAVVFHSYSGSTDEARSILKRGVNAYFSFGNAILLNHKNARRCAADLEAEHLLFETDCPYQMQKGRTHSSYADIFDILSAAMLLRADASRYAAPRYVVPLHTNANSGIFELEQITDNNFCAVFGQG
jgi:TatD DNase family protein